MHAGSLFLDGQSVSGRDFGRGNKVVAGPYYQGAADKISQKYFAGTGTPSASDCGSGFLADPLPLPFLGPSPEKTKRRTAHKDSEGNAPHRRLPEPGEVRAGRRALGA